MKTILIETCSNGWIVRPFQTGPEWLCPERPCIAVYNRLEDLQHDIPKLLEFEGYVNSVTSSKAPVEFVEVGGDRTPETIGGNELTPSS